MIQDPNKELEGVTFWGCKIYELFTEIKGFLFQLKVEKMEMMSRVRFFT